MSLRGCRRTEVCIRRGPLAVETWPSAVRACGHASSRRSAARPRVRRVSFDARSPAEVDRRAVADVALVVSDVVFFEVGGGAEAVFGRAVEGRDGEREVEVLEQCAPLVLRADSPDFVRAELPFCDPADGIALWSLWETPSSAIGKLIRRGRPRGALIAVRSVRLPVSTWKRLELESRAQNTSIAPPAANVRSNEMVSSSVGAPPSSYANATDVE